MGAAPPDHVRYGFRPPPHMAATPSLLRSKNPLELVPGKRALIPLSRIWDTLLGDWGSRTPRPQEVEWFESLPGAKGLPRRVPGCPVGVEMPEVMVDREEAYASARGVVWDRGTLRLLEAGGPHPVL